jgi:hypothetical protein
MSRFARYSLLFALALGPAAAAVASNAQASVSIAVGFDALVRTSSAAAIATPVEQRSVWENDRIYTYTRVHVETSVAGELPVGSEAWVRTMGGIVGHIGQVVDGEAVLTMGRPSLLFLQAGPPGAYEVTARAQGQFVVKVDAQKRTLLARSSAVGVLFPRAGTDASTAPSVLASDVLHGRPVEDAIRDIAAAWSRLHAH